MLYSTCKIVSQTTIDECTNCFVRMMRTSDSQETNGLPEEAGEEQSKVMDGVLGILLLDMRYTNKYC